MRRQLGIENIFRYLSWHRTSAVYQCLLASFMANLDTNHHHVPICGCVLGIRHATKSYWPHLPNHLGCKPNRSEKTMVLTSAVFKPPPTSFQYRLWVERGGFPADFDNPICVGCYRLETPPLENVGTLGISNTAGMMIAARKKKPVAPKNVIFCPPLLEL